MIEYIFEEEGNRSAAYYEDALIGECDFIEQDGKWLITHTEVRPEFGGRGIAKELVLLVKERADDKAIEIVPLCSYAVKVLQ